VDSLINASEAAGKKNEAASLTDDYSALTKIRRSLSAYIQEASAQWETHGKAPSVALSAPPAQQRQGFQSQNQQRTQSSQQQNQQRAAASQPAPATQVVDDQGVKKIIVDDTIPEKKTPPAAKKKPETFSNL
jgi:hypothetical protein